MTYFVNIRHGVAVASAHFRLKCGLGPLLVWSMITAAPPLISKMGCAPARGCKRICWVGVGTYMQHCKLNREDLCSCSDSDWIWYCYKCRSGTIANDTAAIQATKLEKLYQFQRVCFGQQRVKSNYQRSWHQREEREYCWKQLFCLLQFICNDSIVVFFILIYFVSFYFFIAFRFLLCFYSFYCFFPHPFYCIIFIIFLFYSFPIFQTISATLWCHRGSSKLLTE